MKNKKVVLKKLRVLSKVKNHIVDSITIINKVEDSDLKEIRTALVELLHNAEEVDMYLSRRDLGYEE